MRWWKLDIISVFIVALVVAPLVGIILVQWWRAGYSPLRFGWSGFIKDVGVALVVAVIVVPTWYALHFVYGELTEWEEELKRKWKRKRRARHERD